VFAGDRRSADALKSLSTAHTMGLETKGLPSFSCPVAVNLWLASNHEGAHVEEKDARYWIHDVSPHAAYFAALVDEIESGGAEAFAHYLLTLDVSSFVPARDTERDNEARRAMIRESINPYDARKWLEECCEAAQILGSGRRMEMEWKAGEAIAFSTLRAAYVEWQGGVRTRVAPRPTPLNRLGELLGRCGFVEKRVEHERERARVLPTTGACLAGLCS
jgi:hypothetical protein